MFLLNGQSPWHWAIGGAAIGLFVIALQYFFNRSFGISRGFEHICALFSRSIYFTRSSLKSAAHWRLPFVIGLVLGGLASVLLAGAYETSWALGLFDQAAEFSALSKTIWMFAGGFLIGAGTRLAGGCTSGHGIFGIATLQRASFVTVASFMLAGIIAGHVIHKVLFPL